jgi:polyphosphate kinase 2 (PPK2 family)
MKRDKQGGKPSAKKNAKPGATKVAKPDAKDGAKPEKMKRKDYEAELERLHGELVKLQTRAGADARLPVV